MAGDTMPDLSVFTVGAMRRRNIAAYEYHVQFIDKESIDQWRLCSKPGRPYHIRGWLESEKERLEHDPSLHGIYYFRVDPCPT